MNLSGKDTPLQTGDVICLDRKSSSLTISRGGVRMSFANGSEKFFFGGEDMATDSDLTLVARLLAQTHNFALSGMRHLPETKDPYYTFEII
jgi:hypothetical protein